MLKLKLTVISLFVVTGFATAYAHAQDYVPNLVPFYSPFAALTAADCKNLEGIQSLQSLMADGYLYRMKQVGDQIGRLKRGDPNVSQKALEYGKQVHELESAEFTDSATIIHFEEFCKSQGTPGSN